MDLNLANREQGHNLWAFSDPVNSVFSGVTFQWGFSRVLGFVKTFKITVLPGDGIGPDVTNEALRVLQAVEQGMSSCRFECEEHAVGAAEYLKNGNPLPDTAFEACRSADAVLLSAMGLPDVRWP